jgi:hypothetical protein
MDIIILPFTLNTQSMLIISYQSFYFSFSYNHTHTHTHTHRSLALKEQKGLKVYENRMLKSIFEVKMDDIIAG